jgi:hypothetical protein
MVFFYLSPGNPPFHLFIPHTKECRYDLTTRKELVNDGMRDCTWDILVFFVYERLLMLFYK